MPTSSIGGGPSATTWHHVHDHARRKPMAARIVELAELPPLLKKDARLMGLDLGEKTIGLALSDVKRTIASPLRTLKRVKFRADAAALLQLARLHDVGGFGL